MLAWIAAVLVAVVGGVLVVIDALTPTSFSYFVSGRFEDATRALEDVVVFSRSGAIGGVLLTVGLVALAYLIGVRTGSRRERPTRE